MNGLLLIERFVPAKPAANGAEARTASARYRGFDGVVWPGETVRDFRLEDGLAPMSELDRILGYYEKVRLDPWMDLVYIAEDRRQILPGFSFAGFDAGYYESEYLHYSVLLNEVIFGSVPSLVAFGSRLNDALLLATPTDGAELLEVRRSLLGTRTTLERGDEEIVLVPIFAVTRTAPGPR